MIDFATTKNVKPVNH